MEGRCHDREDLAFLLANKYSSGRVVYASDTRLPSELMHKILLWLGHNKIGE